MSGGGAPNVAGHIPHATVRVERPGDRERAPVSRLALWVGLLAGPVAFAANHMVSVMVVPWACATSRYGATQVPSFVALLVALAGAALAWRTWHAAGGSPQGGRGLADVPGDVAGAPIGGTHGDAGGAGGRSRALALAGVLTSAGFVLVVVAQWIPTLLIGPCARSG